MKILTKPYTIKEMKANKVDIFETQYIEGYIEVSLDEIIKRDYEEFLDLISEKLTGSILLREVVYKIIGLNDQNNNIILFVSGDATIILEDEIDFEEDEDDF